ncbi:hypothetical protein BJ322DRAFT_1111791 [Thelephora terrestris]|uniref:F-box domain-containing protein n=1 Tax=Thelephora terrestris TaxID=56493 RepID=A0A9P6H8Y4_9AGAM|nr:hypothetical protein BJ322DRAFT_1111791 [Thelephora terrestris]
MGLPAEILEKIIHLFYLSGNRTPPSLNSVALCSHTFNSIARKFQFQTVSVCTYHDLSVCQEIVNKADHLLLYTKTLRVIRPMSNDKTCADLLFINNIGVILPQFTGVTSLVVGGFPIDLSAFDRCKRIRFAGFVQMDLNHHPTKLSIAKFLVKHKPRATHFEGCKGPHSFDEHPGIELHQGGLCPQVATLSIVTDDQAWIKEVSQTFPNITSLCVNPLVMRAVQQYPSLQSLTITGPAKFFNYTALTTCTGLRTVRIVFPEETQYDILSPHLTFPKIHGCLPPSVTSVITVASTSPSIFSLLKDLVTMPLMQPDRQYTFVLSPCGYHDHLSIPHVSLLQFERNPPQLKEGPRIKYPGFGSLEPSDLEILDSMQGMGNVLMKFIPTPYHEYREDLWLEGSLE